jgi:hypothetical protein
MAANAGTVDAGAVPSVNLPEGAAANTAASDQAAMGTHTAAQNFSNMGKGLASFGSTPGSTASEIYANTGKLGIAGLAAPAAYQNYSQSQIPTSSQPFNYYTMGYNQGKFNPYFGQNGQAALLGQGYTTPTASTFTPTGYAKGGVTRLAGGGPMPIRPNVSPPSANDVASAAPHAPQSNFLVAPASQGAKVSPSASNPIAQYYASLMATPSNLQAGPSQAQTNNYNNYMSALNNQVQGNAATPIQNTGAMSNTGGSPSGATAMNISPGSSGWTSLVNQISNGANTATVQDGNPSSTLGFATPGSGGAKPLAKGGIASLGGYSDGGQMLKGPGDGMSDSIPATIDGHQKAALATDEFVVPADVVSHLGNGSSDAGAKKLYSMLDRIRMARTGTKQQGKKINPDKLLPA